MLPKRELRVFKGVCFAERYPHSECKNARSEY